MTTTFRPATSEDITFVAEHMRQEDVLEVGASAGCGPLQALAMSVIESDRAYTAIINGVPACIFGFCQMDDATCVWLLGTDYLVHEGLREFLVNSRAILDRWASTFGLLYNAVDVNNAKSRRWLRWCGFKEQRVIPEYGEARLPFIMMTRT